MPVVSAEVIVPVDPETAFAVSQTSGAVRRLWDVFIAEQHFLDGATAAVFRGVRTLTRQRFGLAMVSRYVSHAPPRNTRMVMEDGPWFAQTLKCSPRSQRALGRVIRRSAPLRAAGPA